MVAQTAAAAAALEEETKKTAHADNDQAGQKLGIVTVVAGMCPRPGEGDEYRRHTPSPDDAAGLV